MNVIQNIPDIIKQIGLSGFLDILFITIFIYAILVLFKQSKARLIIIGLFILSCIYIIAQHLNLVLTTTLLHTFFAVIIIAVIVIFQEEIRRFFEQIAVWSLNPKIRRNKQFVSNEREVEIMTECLTDFATQKVGALIILPGKTSLTDYLEGGEELDGRLSEPLLKSIFDPHSMGHDGAVVIDKGKIKLFGAHLPLSNNFSQLGHRGTRHAAALGLAEVSDALCLVVSEERGTVSIAKNSVLMQIDIKDLRSTLQYYYNDLNPSSTSNKRLHLTSNFLEKLISIVLALLLWFVFVYESRLTYRSFVVPVNHTSLPNGLKISEIEPQKVKLTFLGPKRDFYFLSDSEIDLILKIPEPKPGVQNVDVTKSDIVFPDDLTLEEIDTDQVKVRIEKSVSKNQSKNSE